MEDFFQTVSSQLNEELSFMNQANNSNTQNEQLSSNFYFDHSVTYFHEPSREKSIITRKQSTVKTKKSKNIDNLQVSQFDPFCLRQITYNGDLAKQLLRLQKTLQTESKPKKSGGLKKRKCLIKRLNVDKQNNDENQKSKINEGISSKQLQQIKNMDQDLYNVCIELLRFCECQKEHQQRLVQEMNVNRIDLEDKKKELCQLKIALENKIAEESKQEKKESKMDYLQFRKLYNSYSNGQIDFII